MILYALCCISVASVMVVLSISRFQICSAHTQRATQNRCKFHKLNGKRARRCAHTRCSFEPLWRCLLLLSWNCQPSRVHALIKWHQLCPLARAYIYIARRRGVRAEESALTNPLSVALRTQCLGVADFCRGPTPLSASIISRDEKDADEILFSLPVPLKAWVSFQAFWY